MNDIIYFEINNWFQGRNYPPIPYIIDNLYKFSDDDWCKSNELCVVVSAVDMSTNWCVSAKKSWIEKNVPELLTDNTYSYYVLRQNSKVTETKKYSDFLRYPDEKDGCVYSQFGTSFLDWSEDILGAWYRDVPDES